MSEEHGGLPLYNFVKMCNACPFRPKAAKGWLGSYTPEMIIDHLRQEIPFLCHDKVDYNDPDWREHDQEHCVGALIMMRRMAKLPRDPVACGAVRNVPDDEILYPPQAFIAHHNREELSKD